VDIGLLDKEDRVLAFSRNIRESIHSVAAYATTGENKAKFDRLIDLLGQIEENIHFLDGLEIDKILQQLQKLSNSVKSYNTHRIMANMEHTLSAIEGLSTIISNGLKLNTTNIFDYFKENLENEIKENKDDNEFVQNAQTILQIINSNFDSIKDDSDIKTQVINACKALLSDKKSFKYIVKDMVESNPELLLLKKRTYAQNQHTQSNGTEIKKNMKEKILELLEWKKENSLYDIYKKAETKFLAKKIAWLLVAIIAMFILYFKILETEMEKPKSTPPAYSKYGTIQMLYEASPFAKRVFEIVLLTSTIGLSIKISNAHRKKQEEYAHIAYLSKNIELDIPAILKSDDSRDSKKKFIDGTIDKILSNISDSEKDNEKFDISHIDRIISLYKKVSKEDKKGDEK